MSHASVYFSAPRSFRRAQFAARERVKSCVWRDFWVRALPRATRRTGRVAEEIELHNRVGHTFRKTDALHKNARTASLSLSTQDDFIAELDDDGRRRDKVGQPAMGIGGLLPLLKEVQKSCHVRDWAGKRVAVDSYVSREQFTRRTNRPDDTRNNNR